MVRSSTSHNGDEMSNHQAPVPPPLPESSMIDDSPVGFEGGRLTTSSIINNNGDQLLQVQPPPTADPNTIYVCSENRDTRPLFFHIQTAKIYPQDGDNANAKKYVCYDIAVQGHNNNKSPSSSTFNILRRYTDFLQLYEGLRKDYPSLLQSVIFPKKCFMGNFSWEVVVERVVLFEQFLDVINNRGELHDSDHFLRFLQDQELERACRLLDERRSEAALPILENCFGCLNKIYMDRSNSVLLVLCRLVAASAHPIPAPDANKWADLALRRFDGVCDADLLQLYVPLIKACVYLFWKTGRDKSQLDEQLEGMRKRGINVKSGPTLQQAIHALDPRTESA